MPTLQRPRITNLPSPLRKKLLTPRTRRHGDFEPLPRRNAWTPAAAVTREVHGNFAETAAVSGVVEDWFVSV